MAGLEQMGTKLSLQQDIHVESFKRKIKILGRMNMPLLVGDSEKYSQR